MSRLFVNRYAEKTQSANILRTRRNGSGLNNAAKAVRQPRAEHELTPYHPLTELGIRSLLVLAPHPDDEVLGCGGLMALAVAQGVRVYVVVLSDGAAGGGAAQQEQECCTAAHAIGYLQRTDALSFWRLPDRGVLPDAALIQRIAQTIDTCLVEWVLAPSPFEIHPDHRAVCLAAMAACAMTNRRLGFYEVGQPLMPNCLVDISAVLDVKQQAMRCFESQMAVQDYGEHIAALNRYRSYTLGPRVTHAEAFHFVEPPVLAGGIEAMQVVVQQSLADRFVGFAAASR